MSRSDYPENVSKNQYNGDYEYEYAPLTRSPSPASGSSSPPLLSKEGRGSAAPLYPKYDERGRNSPPLIPEEIRKRASPMQKSFEEKRASPKPTLLSEEVLREAANQMHDMDRSRSRERTVMPQDNRLTQLKKQDATVTPQDNRYAAPKASGHIPRQDTTVVPQDNRFAASKVSENYDQGVDYSPIKKPSDYQDKRIKRPSQDSNISSYKAAMDQSGSDQYQGDDWKVVVPNPTQRTDDDDDDLISRQKLAEVCHCQLPLIYGFYTCLIFYVCRKL